MKAAPHPSTPSAKRRYDGQARQQEARARRRRIIDEAHRLFLEDGYAATSIDGIAAAAGVSVQTVYAVFSSKAGVLARVIDVAIGGDDEDVMVRDRPEFRPVLEATTPEELVWAAVRHARMTHERSGPILHLLDQVAGTDAALAELAAEIRRQVREETAFVVDRVAPEWLRPGFSREERIATSFLLTFHTTWWWLTQELGWSTKRYEDYVAKALLRLLVVDA
jgi:TetR/AcrR family transcriptional regulator of autoinduction and epiphytic fitness